MSVDRSVPTPPPTVTGQSPKDEVVVVSVEAVEKAARAMNLEAGRQRGLAFEDDWHTLTEQERGGWRLCARAALSAALPVIERDLRADERERCAKEIEAAIAGWASDPGVMSCYSKQPRPQLDDPDAFARAAAARLREGGRA